MRNEAQDYEDDQLTTAVGLVSFAKDYIDAAIVVDRSFRKPPNPLGSMPAYYLALHGIELTFKGFLRSKGIRVRDLRSPSYAHDVHVCNRKARELGLLFHFSALPIDDQTLALLAHVNKHQAMRYMRSGWYQLPDWDHVESLAVRLHQAVATVVG